MADVFTKEQRSAVMARVRSRGNRSTELQMIALLRLHGLKGWRRGVPVFGKPDFVWPRERVALFVDGCFWHGCPRHATHPADNKAYWAPKLVRNKARDRAVGRALRAAGWRVLRVWECALRAPRRPATMRRIARALAP